MKQKPSKAMAPFVGAIFTFLIAFGAQAATIQNWSEGRATLIRSDRIYSEGRRESKTNIEQYLGDATQLGLDWSWHRR